MPQTEDTWFWPCHGLPSRWHLLQAEGPGPSKRERCPLSEPCVAEWGPKGGGCSVTKSCATLCDPMDCSTPGFPVHHQLRELAQTHVCWVSDTIQSSHPVFPTFSCPQAFPASWSFPMSWLYTSGGQSIGASVSVLPMSIQGWFPFLIYLLSKGLSTSGHPWKCCTLSTHLLPSPPHPRFWHHEVTHSSKHGDWDEGINCPDVSKPLPWSLLTIEEMRRSLVLKEVARDCRPGGIKRKTSFPKREEVTSKRDIMGPLANCPHSGCAWECLDICLPSGQEPQGTQPCSCGFFLQPGSALWNTDDS